MSDLVSSHHLQHKINLLRSVPLLCSLFFLLLILLVTITLITGQDVVQKLKLVWSFLFEAVLPDKTAEDSDLLFQIVLKVELVLRTKFDVGVVVVQSLFGDSHYLGSFLQIDFWVFVSEFSPF